MIRLAFYIRDSQEIDRRHVPPISEAIRGSGGIEYSYVSTKAKKVSTLRGPAQFNWQACRGHSVSPPNTLTPLPKADLDKYKTATG